MEVKEDEVESNLFLKSEVEINMNKILQSSFDDKEGILRCLKELRNICSRGHLYQETIAENQAFNGILRELIFTPKAKKHNRKELHLMALQVMANCIVGNEISQRMIWNQHGDQITAQASVPPLDESNNILLMIIFNTFKTRCIIPEKTVLVTCVNVWQTLTGTKCQFQLEYLHFLFEQLLVHEGHIIAENFRSLLMPERICLLTYIVSYLRDGSPNGKVAESILLRLATEFKIVFGHMLRLDSLSCEPTNTYVVHLFLRVIAHICGNEMYRNIYSTDHSLFVDIGTLLRSLFEYEKKRKDDRFATHTDFDPTFEMRTLLVRCMANLLYNNAVNRERLLDLDLLPSLLDCTVTDPRNPLVREWSILAIRNACIDSPEVQEFIRNVTVQGPAPNNFLAELNIGMGALNTKSKKT